MAQWGSSSQDVGVHDREVVVAGRRGRGVAVFLGCVLALAVAVAGGWWAARATLEPQTETAEKETNEVVWAEATTSSVGRSLPLSTTLRQPARTVASNTLPGVVLDTFPGEVDQGETLYVVAGTPVRAIEGTVPFYRDLERDVEGDDVAQLQQALIDLEHLTGEPDGEFGPRTEDALEAWQEDLGVEETGTVTLGELIAIDDLPTTIQLGEAIVRGASLGGGEEAVLAPTGEQQFVLVVTQDQARMIPAEATLEIAWQEHTWSAAIAGSTQDEFGNTEFDLSAPDGGPVCADACDTLPGDAQVTLRSEVILVPEISGTAVPAAAVHTRADSTAYVLTEEGETDVTVRGSGGGIAIVDGIEPGTRVQALGGSTPVPQPGPAPGQETPSEDPGQEPGSDEAPATEG